MNALLNPANRKIGGVRWALVAHTTVMFSVVTALTAINVYALLVAYIDDREYPGTDEIIAGPLGYEDLVSSEAPTITSNVLFVLNQWFADALLVSRVLFQNRMARDCLIACGPFVQLYRCCVIYTMNYWILAFPCLVYLASLGACSTVFFKKKTDTNALD